MSVFQGQSGSVSLLRRPGHIYLGEQESNESLEMYLSSSSVFVSGITSLSSHFPCGVAWKLKLRAKG